MILLSSSIADLFKYKIVTSIIVLTCDWSKLDQLKFSRELFANGMRATFSCNPQILSKVPKHGVQGVFYICDRHNDTLLEKVLPEHFSMWYKWLVICDLNPFDKVRYDSDITNMVATSKNYSGYTQVDNVILKSITKIQYIELKEPVFFSDVYVHPAEKASMYPWATWTSNYGLQVTHDRQKTLRKLDLKGHELRIVVPRGHYSPTWYNGSQKEYLEDETIPQLDSGVRCGYIAGSLVLQSLNITEKLLLAERWNIPTHNDSMVRVLMDRNAEIGGGILRIRLDRIILMDYIVPVWPFGTGFTYLGERASSSNMYVQPFTPNVWWCCLATGLILAVTQRLTAKKPDEKEEAYISVLATWLQQDASSVPENPSGRWSFTVMSISAMLVHAYYTSAIVSALMSSGVNGPKTLRELADSKYSIYSEDYDLMRYIVFDIDTKWDDLEYLKKKKANHKLYIPLEQGLKRLIEENVAFHTEYNTIYPCFKNFTDNQLCRLQFIDTIPESQTWITTYKRSEWTEIFRSKGAWIYETGIVKRIIAHIRVKTPPCRAALFAEQVGFGDVAPLLALTALGGLLSVVILVLEVIVAKLRKRNISTARTVLDSVEEEFEYYD